MDDDLLFLGDGLVGVFDVTRPSFVYEWDLFGLGIVISECED